MRRQGHPGVWIPKARSLCTTLSIKSSSIQKLVKIQENVTK